MILYVSGTGYCLAIARAIADTTNDDVLPLTQAALGRSANAPLNPFFFLHTMRSRTRPLTQVSG